MSPGSAEDVPEFNLPLKYPGEIAGVLAGFYNVFVVLHYCQPPGAGTINGWCIKTNHLKVREDSD